MSRIRKWARLGLCWLLAAALAPVALAAPSPATNLTIDQLDQLLKQVHGQSDAGVARQIAGVHLTERPSVARVAQWEASLAGDRSREALMVVADVSAFLAPRAAETPTTPPPDAPAQQQILARCREYVNQRVSGLPNYIALRTTASFEFTTADRLESQPIANGLLQTKQGNKLHYQALGPAKSSNSPEYQYFWLGTRARDVTYRGQAEVTNAAPEANGQSQSSFDPMTTSGEFGSVLEVIVVDFSEDQVVWDHWEQGSQGPLAVFRYAVPHEKSHVAVHYANEQPEFPAYHGEVAIDPESGAVWRITILASGSDAGFFDESSMLVEFAPTEIAGVTYICPVHSVSIMRFFDTFEYANTAHTPVPIQISINDVAFTNYHLFRSEAHILAGATGP